MLKKYEILTDKNIMKYKNMAQNSEKILIEITKSEIFSMKIVHCFTETTRQRKQYLTALAWEFNNIKEPVQFAPSTNFEPFEMAHFPILEHS